MPIPLRELALVTLLVPAAIGMEMTCLRADLQLDAAQVERTCITRRMVTRGKLAERSACNEQSMLAGWDIQLKMQAECRERDAASPGKKVPYESASL